MPSTVLVTGGTGFTAQWLIYELLKQNYKVKTTIRSEGKKELFKNVFADELQSCQLELIVVPDLAVPGALDPHLTNVDYLYSIASVFRFAEITDFKSQMVDATIKIAKNVFTSADKAGVKRVILTGSVACVMDMNYGPDRDYTYTEKDFNTMSYEAACEAPPGIAYMAAKALAERAMWELQEKSKTELVALHMAWIMGPSLLPITETKQLTESNIMIGNLFKDKIFPEMIPCFIDGRDLARAHVSALKPAASGKRYLVNSGEYSAHDVVLLMNKHFDLNLEVPERLPTCWKMSTERIEKDLGFRAEIGLEQCIIDCGNAAKKLK